MEIKEYLKQKFTEKGAKDLLTKLKTTIRFYNEDSEWEKLKNNKPKMLGFPDWNVEIREELYGRIKELAQLLGANLNENIQIEATETEKIEKKKIEFVLPYKLEEVFDDNF